MLWWLLLLLWLAWMLSPLDADADNDADNDGVDGGNNSGSNVDVVGETVLFVRRSPPFDEADLDSLLDSRRFFLASSFMASNLNASISSSV